MQQETQTALDRLLRGEPLGADTLERAVGAMMDGRCDEVEVAALLTALETRGVTASELAGAARAMRARAASIRSERPGLLDTCGTGGDHLQTFNISTATALVVAAAGVPVAKHGNRSVSSTSGSADVLEALGVNVGISPEQAGRCLDDLGICFCFARTCHAAMRHVAPVRQKLGFRSIFNLLGPLTNPAGAEFQLLGASRDQHAERIAAAAQQLQIRRALVVCGNDQLDEVSLWGNTRVWDVRQEGVKSLRWTAADFGLPECRPENLRVGSPQESAEVIRELCAGSDGPPRHIVLANAAAALWCHGDVEDLRTGVELAAAAIDQQAAEGLLARLRDWTNSLE